MLCWIFQVEQMWEHVWLRGITNIFTPGATVEPAHSDAEERANIEEATITEEEHELDISGQSTSQALKKRQNWDPVYLK